MKVGVFPIRNHFYEPQFDNRDLRTTADEERPLRGIDWNVEGQLAQLERFVYADELMSVPLSKTEALEFHFNNGTFEAGDAEYWYQIIRCMKPRRIFEIGSGNSTLMARKAVRKNQEEDTKYTCEHVCIEPYKARWLEETDVSVVRKRVEMIEVDFFSALGEGDILFIDSSHVIRPQGDVLYEYLELLPSLREGVIVHIHDIFSPRDYLRRWMEEEVKFWNEQYLLEAFLTENKKWEILGACSYLHHNHYDRLKEVAPYLTRDREPGSFYVRRLV